jgi:hypothetical protein
MQNKLIAILKQITSKLKEAFSVPESEKSFDEDRINQTSKIDESPELLELDSIPAGLWVQCAVCGIPHELEAVCFICGAPLCRDQIHCRTIEFRDELRENAVCCPMHSRNQANNPAYVN